MPHPPPTFAQLWAAALDPLADRGLRAAARLQPVSPALAFCARRAVLALWWAATGQLGMRWAAWRANRARLRRARVDRAPPPLDALPAILPDALVLPLSDAPLVSIVVPSYGQVPATLRCLAAIAAHAGSTRIETPIPAPRRPC
jgi:hypothetical protein